MEWTDTALVLHVGKFREADLWVRLLALHEGMTTAFAFGGSRSRRRFTGCLDVFNLILASAATSRNGAFLNLREATLLEGPARLRQDWRRQGLAANCVRFLEAMGVPPGNAQGGFTLMRGLLALLENAEKVPGSVPLLFRFRLASDQGYAPDFSACARCGKGLGDQSHALFLVSEGYAVCPSCAARAGGGEGMSLRIGAEALDVLAKVQEYSPETWGDFALPPEMWRQVARLIDAFVRHHLGLEWIHGRFVR